MNLLAIPDYTSPIVAYRTWGWDTTLIRSLNGELWFPGWALAAKCLTTNHEPPADRCTCGIYAAKSYQHLQRIGYAGHGIYGEVYLWGKVVEHRFGYRAQYAYPKSLALPPETLPFKTSEVESRLQTLMAYGTDIFIYGRAGNILLWSKESGYNAAGLDRVAEEQKKYRLAEQWVAEQQRKPFAVRRREVTADFNERQKQLLDQALIAILIADLPPEKIEQVLAAAWEMLALERPLGGIRHRAAPFVVKRQELTADFNERQKQLFDQAVIAELTVDLPAEKITEVLAAACDISIRLASGELSCTDCHGYSLTLRGMVVQCDDCGAIQARHDY